MSQSEKPPVPVQTLSYADPGLRRREWIDRFRRVFHARQVTFAAGLAFALGAIGYAVGEQTNTLSETPVCAVIGGLLMGLAIPIPRYGLPRTRQGSPAPEEPDGN